MAHRSKEDGPPNCRAVRSDRCSGCNPPWATWWQHVRNEEKGSGG